MLIHFHSTQIPGGTHLDARLHMIENGEMIETIPLEKLVDSARALDLSHVKDSMGREYLESFRIQEGEWILCKTLNSFSDRFDFESVYLNEKTVRI